MTKIIGFTGGMGVGKSTAVRALEDKLPYGKGFSTMKLIKFAQPLYDAQEFLYERISGAYQRPEDFTKDRKLLQWLGTEWGRETIAHNLWVNVWKSDAEIALLKGFTVVCDDVRFDNEAEAIHSLGGVVISISSDKTGSRIDTSLQKHASEAGINPNLIDKRVTNSASLDQYLQDLEALFASLGLA